MKASYLSSKMIKFFMWSHIIGWVLANLQTIWIVWELRRQEKRLEEKIRRWRGR